MFHPKSWGYVLCTMNGMTFKNIASLAYDEFSYQYNKQYTYSIFTDIYHFLVCAIPVVPGRNVTCNDTDYNGEHVPSPNDVCTAICDSGQTPTVATAICQPNGMYDVALECPAGKC